jgi:hypothetical protein
MDFRWNNIRREEKKRGADLIDSCPLEITVPCYGHLASHCDVAYITFRWLSSLKAQESLTSFMISGILMKINSNLKWIFCFRRIGSSVILSTLFFSRKLLINTSS